MPRIEERIYINAPAEMVYEYIAVPANLLSIWPSLVRVYDVRWMLDGRCCFQWVYRMKGRCCQGISETISYEVNRFLAVRNSGDIESTIAWTFQCEGAGTRVTFVCSYALPFPLHDQPDAAGSVKLNEAEAIKMLSNLKAGLEACDSHTLCDNSVL